MIRCFNGMSLKKRIKFFATKRITVGKITQIENGNFVDYFVGKIGGKIVSGETEWKFKDREDALYTARWYKDKARQELTK